MLNNPIQEEQEAKRILAEQITIWEVIKRHIGKNELLCDHIRRNEKTYHELWRDLYRQYRQKQTTLSAVKRASVNNMLYTLCALTYAAEINVTTNANTDEPNHEN